MKVLIAEQHPTTLQAIRVFVEQAGHHTLVANHAEEAYALFQAHQPWLVISGQQLQDMSGLSLCQRIRQAQSQHYTYFILIDHQQQAIDLMDMGIDDVLAEPIDFKLLHMRLKVAERIATYQAHIRSLEGLVTMCAYTKKVQLPDQTWQRIEDFIENTLGIPISHGIEPSYYQQQILPQLEALKQNHKNTPVPWKTIKNKP